MTKRLSVVPKQQRASVRVTGPQGLSKASQEWFEERRLGYRIDDPAGRDVLLVAAETRDDMAQLRAVLAERGHFYEDHNGILRKHPAVEALATARRTFLSAMRQLKLEPGAEGDDE